MSSITSDVERLKGLFRRNKVTHSDLLSLLNVIDVKVYTAVYQTGAKNQVAVEPNRTPLEQIIKRYVRGQRDKPIDVLTRGYSRLQELLRQLGSTQDKTRLRRVINEIVVLTPALRGFCAHAAPAQPSQMKATKSANTNPAEGSGKWGKDADDRGVGDYAKRLMWNGVADAADVAGMNNAARHMRHYLNNTGRKLHVNVDQILRDVKNFRQEVEISVTQAQQNADGRIQKMSAQQRSAGTSFRIKSSRKRGIYLGADQSKDWFYAIGGCTWWWEGEVKVAPSKNDQPSIATMTITVHLYDRYNWDRGKSVSLMGLTVTDESLGRLHKVGLAREYEVSGKSSQIKTGWVVGTTKGAKPPTPSAGRFSGGRLDPWRLGNSPK